MSLKKKLSITIVLQILGVVATALSSVIIARRYGPAAQGYLSYIRSTVDFLSGLGIFGFPQAFVYMINSRLIKTAWAIRFATVYGLIYSLLALACAGGLILAGPDQVSGLDAFAIAMVALAASGFVWHGMYRAISLSVNSAYVFNLISILPFVGIFAGFLLWAPADYRLLSLVVGLGAIASAGLAYITLVRNREQDRDIGAVNHISVIKQALVYSFWSFLPTISAALTTTVTYTMLRQGGAAEAAAGHFSTSLLFLSASVLPLNMIIPVLYDTWSKSTSQASNLLAYTRLAHVGPLIAAAVAVGAIPLIGYVTRLVFGAAYAPSVRSTQVLLLGAYVLYENRLLSAMLLSLGRPGTVAVGSAIRTGVIVGGLFVSGGDPLLHAALMWNAGELAALAYQSVCVARNTDAPLLQILGLSPAKVLEVLRALAVTRPRIAPKTQL